MKRQNSFALSRAAKFRNSLYLDRTPRTGVVLALQLKVIIMKSLTVFSLGMLAAIGLSFTAQAATYVEVGDAGQSLGTAQSTGPLSQSLSNIVGSLTSDTDIDIFAINIVDFANFSATTVNTLTGSLDTALFLFNSAGQAVYANDDDAGGLSVGSTLPAGNGFGPQSNGLYYLAISLSGAEPVNFANQLLFAMAGVSTDVRGPNPNATGGLSDWDTSLVFGSGQFPAAYQIDLTGAATGVPEPSTYVLCGLGVIVIWTLAKRRRAAAALAASFCLTAGLASATQTVPSNLAGGLGDLVASNVALKNKPRLGRAQTYQANDGRVYTTQAAADFTSSAITDANGRFMVRAHLSGILGFDRVQALARKIPSFTITAVDRAYKGGVLEGYISIDNVPALAQTKGIRSLILELKPELTRAISKSIRPIADAVSGQTLGLLGTAFDQGVTQHRVDRINRLYNPSATSDYQGRGISLGFISDSFGNSATDVTNFDLPGASSNPVNTQPVVVLQDVTATDEGRAMVQIGYKMAPKARLAFATANGGSVNLANNIRALAGLPGYTYDASVQQGFAANVICDDVGYPDEPFFEDGIIGSAVDDVVAAGVSYFSSAGNDIGTYDYDSDYRNVPNTPAALTGTNINLAGVPANLYQGGFHNFNPNPGQQDIAQTVNVTANPPATNFQWDDPYNQTITFNTPPIYTAHGTSDGTATTPSSFMTPSLTAGQNYVITVTADPGSDFDAIVTIKDPNGNTVINMQDTLTDETVNFYPPTTGVYTIIVDIFGGTTGAFTVNVYTANNPQLTTDFNLLVFDLDGNYLPNSSLVTDNYATNIPYEYGKTFRKSGQTQVQYVIARSRVPGAPHPAGHIRYIIRGNGGGGIGPAEYFTYNTPNTHGHSIAQGCNGTAAYSVFRPSIPEYFTSPGPATVYFDKMGNRYDPPQIRLQPGVAAADQANTSFFNGESTSDVDSFLNFGGTSAAAPHAAAIAGLVLEAHGGPGSVTPAQMTDLLHRSAFLHDLDPNYSSGSARSTDGGKISITFQSDIGLNPSTGVNDPNAFRVSYVGPGALTSLVFNPTGTASTGGNVTGGNSGVYPSNVFFSNVYPGEVFEPNTKAFTRGSKTGAVVASDATATFSNQAPAPSVAGQFWTMTLTFANANFTGGSSLGFTVGRGPQHSSVVGNGAMNFNPGPTGGTTSTTYVMADLFGGGVLIPEGTVTQDGTTFSGTTSGGTFSGVMRNRIGSGYTVVDGFGFLDAEAAVAAPLQ